jgi:hypothetical protein
MLARRFCLLWLASLAALALTGSSVMAQSRMTHGELALWTDPEPQGESLHGYTEFRIYIQNKGSENKYRVSLKLPGEDFSHGRGRGGLQSITRTVNVDPGMTVVASLFQPISPEVLGQDIAVFVDGRELKERLRLRPGSGRSMGPYFVRGGRRVYYGPGFSPGAAQPLVLTSQRVNENFFRKAIAAPVGPAAPGGAPPGGPGRGGGRGGMMGPGGFGGPGMGLGGPGFVTVINAQFIRSLAPVSTWSNSWLGYTRYDGIAITREDVQELQRGSNDTRAVLHALWQYAETGGVLLVLGPGDVPVPQAWKRHVLKQSGLTVHSVGFGKCLIAPDRNSDKWDGTGRWEVLREAVNGTSQPWQSSRSLSELNDTFPVVDNLGVPVIGLFVLMILFAIALGPVNLVVLGKKKKRIWMLWTVPALSALTCLAVFGFMIVAEGWQGHASVGGITLLDEIEHRATSLGRTAFYSPLTPGGGLHFSEDTEVAVLGSEGVSSSCSLDWTQGQHLVHGWVSARVPAHFALRSSETRRERLNIRHESDGKLSLLNGLGANIKKITVADEKGRLYVATDIPAGERTTLERDKGTISGDYLPRGAWRDIYKNNSEWIKLLKAPKDVLGPRMYLAVVEGAPFFEQGLHGAAVRKTNSVVLGMMAPEEK